MFKPGNLAKCIDNKHCAITLYNDYIVLETYITSKDNFIVIFDDYGYRDDFYESRFIKVSTYRNNIIDEILL